MSASRRIPLLLVSALATSPVPMFMGPEAIPVQRLIENLTQYIEDKPDDPQLLYNMARLHYLALANESFLVPAFERQGQPPAPAPAHLADQFVWSLRWEEANRLAQEAMNIDANTNMDREWQRRLRAVRDEKMAELEEQGWKPPAPDMDVMHDHAEQASKHFDNAIALAPKMALYQIGRASLGEQCLDFELAGKLPRRRVIEHLTDLTYEKVRDQYYATFALALEPELEVGHLPVSGIQGLVSHEAGLAYLRMTEKPRLAEGQEDRIADVSRGVEKLKGLPMRAITPILIGRKGDTLADLLDPQATVSFDLDGDGVRKDWPWVRPDTGILVWDPYDLGQIESGRQLFGSVTFFLFHRDGYEALRLLDNDQDGELSGIELDGLAVWRDEDGDGQSNASEVQPVWEQGITAIATQGSKGGEGVLQNRRGIRYEDGCVAPTHDWIVKPRALVAQRNRP